MSEGHLCIAKALNSLVESGYSPHIAYVSSKGRWQWSLSRGMNHLAMSYVEKPEEAVGAMLQYVDDNAHI